MTTKQRDLYVLQSRFLFQDLEKLKDVVFAGKTQRELACEKILEYLCNAFMNGVRVGKKSE